MMHFSGYASFVPPSGFPPPNLAMAAVALKSEQPRLVVQMVSKPGRFIYSILVHLQKARKI